MERARNELTGAPGSADAASRALAYAFELSRSRGDSLVMLWVAREQSGLATASAGPLGARRP